MDAIDVTGLMTKILLLALFHWVLVLVALNDLVSRPLVLGRRRGVWALVVVFFLYFGSLLYMLLGRRFETAPALRQEPRRYF